MSLSGGKYIVQISNAHKFVVTNWSYAPVVNDVRGVLIQARALNAVKEAFLSPAKGLKARYASTADVNQV